MSLIITPATASDAGCFAPRLRWSDVVEITRSAQTDPESALAASLKASCQAYRVDHDTGKPLALFGVAPTPGFPKVGICWLLGTPAMEDYPLKILRQAPEFLAQFHAQFPHGLQNYVDAENTLARRWLKLLGFVELQSVIVNRFPFIHVYRHV